jgi:hypothetical protein
MGVEGDGAHEVVPALIVWFRGQGFDREPLGHPDAKSPQ